MQKLLIVCGPTGTGKTDLAISLAKKFNGEIISADSRQVYKDLNIGTGKDLPISSKLNVSNSSLPGFYEIKGVKVWGYDLVDAREKFSVSNYENAVNKILADILKRDKLPIITGGTGLYIKAIVDGIETANISPNISLRKTLEEKTPEELFDILAQFDSVRAANMNQSDKKNPRRLIRAIEIAESGIKIKSKNDSKYETLFIGLTAPKEYIEERIGQRVKKRFDEGVLEEIENLLKTGSKWTDQSMTSMGYAEWKGYFEKSKKTEDILTEWQKHELAYVKRQMVWFKKDKRVNWFDISDSNYKEKVENLAQKWYSS